ncbi:MAG TPA: hypothetical protein VGC86_02090 [Afipia sp.]
MHVGSTNDLKRRFSPHQAGQVVSTKAYLPSPCHAEVLCRR